MDPILPRNGASGKPGTVHSGRLSRSQRLRLSTGARPSAASFRASGMGPRQTRAGTLVRAAGVQAVSPAQRGRSGATRLDGGEHTGTLWV